ncbi:ubiquinol oxidase subunit II [Aneurinibacillus tyrosinisolvens]|uniref:ubiquinol oxidase subunit II n=1 Tax=Aneurinibacillus tyrosinisolvens TaxID=1443435 RepID=UPI00063F4836|nr:cytochrome c oxidase subunit II [Aneurinibacillus tyrosinisolvens]
MKRRKGFQAFIVLAAAACLLLTAGCSPNLLVFNTAGPVAEVEKRLIIISIVLVSIVTIPVILLLFYIIYRYRDTPDNTAPYRPEWSESRLLEIIWWGIPIIIVGILGAYTVRDTFVLTKPQAKAGPPLTIQVVSLNWKWLFLYPEQNIATVNYCQIPVNRTVEFMLTADSPMNSFWVPQLGGQEYTMPGMAMRLWLTANKPGDYYGTGANFTGKGFAHMRFNVAARSDLEFNNWVQQVKRTAPALPDRGYAELAHPSIAEQASFSSFPPELFRKTVVRDGGMYMKKDPRKKAQTTETKHNHAH